MSGGSLVEHLGIVGNCDDATLLDAARTVTEYAETDDEIREFLAMLGLIPTDPTEFPRDSAGRIQWGQVETAERQRRARIDHAWRTSVNGEDLGPYEGDKT